MPSDATDKPAAGGDPSQQARQKLRSYMLPCFILVGKYNFPSGLALDWLVSTLWQIFQKQFVNKKIRGKPSPPATAAEAAA